jgi:hypothetical protein
MATKGSSSIVERYNAPVTQQESAPASPDATQKQAMPLPATPEKK